MRKIDKKIGFTLAEVLLTLGVIGVVAAITIPTLISNYQKKVISVSLKKAYATISNGFRLSEVNNGPYSEWPQGSLLDYDTFWNVYINPYFTGSKICSTMTKGCGYNSESPEFRKQWSGAFWNCATGASELLFQLADGTVILYPKFTNGPNGEIWYSYILFVDVNGPKGPNTYCKDVFPFNRGNGKLEPIDCTLTIVENGWEFPDDYPYRI